MLKFLKHACVRMILIALTSTSLHSVNSYGAETPENTIENKLTENNSVNTELQDVTSFDIDEPTQEPSRLRQFIVNNKKQILIGSFITCLALECGRRHLADQYPTNVLEEFMSRKVIDVFIGSNYQGKFMQLELEEQICRV